MIYDLLELANADEVPDGPINVRCRVDSGAIDGDADGLDSLYLVSDPRNDLGERAALSFWTDASGTDRFEATDPVVLAMVGIDSGEELPGRTYAETSGPPLSRTEEVIARVNPNLGTYEGEQRLYLNVTDLLVRDPATTVGKGYLRSNDPCSRRSYLKYTRRVYQRDPYEWDGQKKVRESSQLRGDVVHRATEVGIDTHPDRFEEGWTEQQVRTLCEELLDEEFSIREALLIISGTGVGDVRDHVVDIVDRLFTDERFSETLLSADSVATERPLDDRFGYQGEVDIVLDGRPYDIKTTRNPSDDRVVQHAYQLELYLFALALEQLEDGQRIADVLADVPTGYLVYPNVEGDAVRFEEVTLDRSRVAEFLADRNEIVTSSDPFAPPSTYDRDCDNCTLKREEWIDGPDDALPPACTYHCQNERRWPCYELEDGTVTSDCSLFERCTQRQAYRDPDRIDHFERVRAGLQAERTSRELAAGAFDRLDPDLVAESGRRIPELELAGVSGGSVVRYESSNPVVPAFDPGEIVQVRPTSGGRGYPAVYHGNDGPHYEFAFQRTGPPPGAVIDPSATYEAVPADVTAKIDDQYLPYVDFAQRRGYPATPADDGSTSASADGAETIEAPGEVADYLDRAQVFVDVPVREERSSDVADLVEAVVSTDVPRPDGTGSIANEDARTLVLGADPALVDAAHAGQPSEDHFRMDGTSHGEESIEASDGSHAVQQRLLTATSIVSSVSYATSDWPTRGHTEVFHSFTDGEFVSGVAEYPDRAHTDRFFDTLVLLGAESITEPEYRFLQDVADRVVAVGDRRQRGPEMTSEQATAADLDVSQFDTGFEHFASFPSDAGVSLQLPGHAPPALETYYAGDEWEPLAGSIEFLDIEGDEETTQDTIAFRTTVRASEGFGHRLVFDVTDTSANAMSVIDAFSDRERLDHTRFTPQQPAVVDGHPLYLAAVEDLQDEDPDRHEIVVQVEAAEMPQFGRALLTNRTAERIVAQVVADRDVDLVVTPFERHATNIRRRLLDDGHGSVRVARPGDLDGEIAEHAVVSFATANDRRIPRPAVTEPEVLYGMLSCGRNLTLVGNGSTLQSKDLFRELIETAKPYEGS